MGLGRSSLRCAVRGLALLIVAIAALPGAAAGEQASQPTSPSAGSLTTGSHHSCALQLSAVRCWGYGGDGQLGYGNTRSIGDDEAPGSVRAVDLPAGRGARALSAGNVHTCALLDDASVRCWGFAGNGRLGYGNTQPVGDNEAPASVGPVNLGAGRTARAITAGDGHTCVILDTDAVRCWGYGFDGRLGYNSTDNIGDDEVPGAFGPVNFGAGLTAKAISAGSAHTCAVLSDDTVRCWGFAGAGRLGYGNTADVGRGCLTVVNSNVCAPSTAAPRTDTVGPVNLGQGRTARAISAGLFHTCALLDDGSVRCWGFAGSGRLGYGNEETIGDNETPDRAGPVDLGPGRTAKAISAGGDHTCAILDDNTLRCWGYGAFGQLGYAGPDSIGDDETPRSVGPVDLGPGRTATAVSAGLHHTCARLDNDSVRCWGYGANGRLGDCSQRTIGDDERPTSIGPVNLSSAACPTATGSGSTRTPVGAGGGARSADPRLAEAARLGDLRGCLSKVRRHARREVGRARRLSGRRGARSRRHARRHRRQLRRRCLKRYGRTPGKVTGFSARATSDGRVVLTFRAPGSDGARAPAARNYLVKQSRRPIRSARSFRRAPSLCRGRCSFRISMVGARLTLRVTDVRRRTRYYFAVAARDNVSKRIGPRSRTVAVRVR